MTVPVERHVRQVFVQICQPDGGNHRAGRGSGNGFAAIASRALRHVSPGFTMSGMLLTARSPSDPGEINSAYRLHARFEIRITRKGPAMSVDPVAKKMSQASADVGISPPKK